MALQLYMLGDAELMLSQFMLTYSTQKYLGSETVDGDCGNADIGNSRRFRLVKEKWVC